MNLPNLAVLVPLLLLVAIVGLSSSLPTSKMKIDIPQTVVPLETESVRNQDRDANSRSTADQVMEIEMDEDLKPIATTTSTPIRVRYWAPTINFLTPEAFENIARHNKLEAYDYWVMRLWQTEYLMETHHTPQEHATLGLVEALLKGREDQVKRGREAFQKYIENLYAKKESDSEMDGSEIKPNSLVLIGELHYVEEEHQVDEPIESKCENVFYFKVCRTVTTESQPHNQVYFTQI